MSRKEQKSITFAEGTRCEDTLRSQNSSAYKEALSQPPPNMSHKEKLMWLQKRRSVGLWVLCDDCGVWRRLPHVLDSKELPEKWYCRMNPDATKASCAAVESPLKLCDEEDLIHSEYSAGSVVWARLDGWPWWPAMVDDCVDTEQFYWLDGFSDIPTHYNVVFFDSIEVTRSWISPENLKPYNDSTKNALKHLLQDSKHKKRIQAAMSQADDAVKLSLPERLEKYSFIARYKGPIRSPKKPSKETLLKIQKKMQKKYNITFPIESSSESEEGYYSPSDEAETIKNNVLIVGTRKSVKSKAVTKSIPKSSTMTKKHNSDNDKENEKLETKLNENLTNDTPKSNIGIRQAGRKKKLVIESETQDLPESPKRLKLIPEEKCFRVPDNVNDMNSQSTLVLTQIVGDTEKGIESLVVEKGSSTPLDDEVETMINETRESSEFPSSEHGDSENVTTRIQKIIRSPVGSDDFEFE